MRCEAGKTYVLRNGKVVTLVEATLDNSEVVLVVQDSPLYCYGNNKSKRDSSVYDDLKHLHPYDIVCELMKEGD